MLLHLRNGTVTVLQFLPAWALVWSYLNLGATPEPILLTLYLVLAAACVVILVVAIDVGMSRREHIVVTGVGLALTFSVAMLPSLEALGFVTAAIGWAGYLLTRRVIGHQLRKITRAVQGIIVLGCAQAIYGLTQALGGLGTTTTVPGLPRVATGSLISANHFAGLILVTLALTLGLLSGGLERRHAQKRNSAETAAIAWVALLVCSILGASILLSASRSGALGVFAVILLMALVQQVSRRRSAHSVSASLFVILGLMILGLAASLGIDPLLSDLQRHGVGNRPRDVPQRAATYRRSSLDRSGPWTLRVESPSVPGSRSRSPLGARRKRPSSRRCRVGSTRRRSSDWPALLDLQTTDAHGLVCASLAPGPNTPGPGIPGPDIPGPGTPEYLRRAKTRQLRLRKGPSQLRPTAPAWPGTRLGRRSLRAALLRHGRGANWPFQPPYCSSGSCSG